MTILDANVLLYAYNADAPEQKIASGWLSSLVSEGEPIGLPWVTSWAFIRVSTNSRIWPSPLSGTDALGIIGDWLAQPAVVPLNPGPRHAAILEKLVRTHGVSGPLVTDAVLAALAIEYGATLASTDQDFRRFPNLRGVNPMLP